MGSIFSIISKMSPLWYAIAGLALTFALFAWDVNKEIGELNTRIDRLKIERGALQEEVGSLKTQRYNLERALDSQTKAVEALEIDYEDRLQQYNDLPTTVRYDTIIKYIGVQSNECNDTKSILNTIRNIDYSQL